MSVEIKWLPSAEGDVATYVLERAPSVLGPWTQLATIVNDATGPFYEASSGLFAYPDPDGTEFLWYRLKAIDTAGLISDPSDPFRAQPTRPTYGESQVKVNHDYPTPGRLTYLTVSGVGVDGALVRAFKASDYEANVATPPAAVTITENGGRWKDNMYLTPGYTYIILYAKEGAYGPDSVRVDV